MFLPSEQGEIIDKYNLIVNAYNQINDIKLLNLNQDGVCNGISSVYILFAKQDRRDEFYHYLQFIAQLNPSTIQPLVRLFSTKNNNKNKFVSVNLQGKKVKIYLNKLLDFFHAIQAAQDQQRFHLIGAYWDDTSTILCPQTELALQLDKFMSSDARFFFMSIGDHSFVVEKMEYGFHLLEPNNISSQNDTYSTTTELANQIILNARRFMESKTIQTKNTTSMFLLSIFSLRYAMQSDREDHGHNNLARNDFERIVINEFSMSKKNQYHYPALVKLIELYSRNLQSTADFALTLRKMINEIIKQNPVITPDLVKLKNTVDAYINQYNIDNHQQNMTDLFKKNQDGIDETPFTNHFTALILAIKAGQEDLTEFLLNLNANPNKRDRKGLTSLHLAAECGNVRIMKSLIAHNGDPDASIHDGTTPLHIATLHGHLDVIRELIKHVRNIDATQSMKRDDLLLMMNPETTPAIILNNILTSTEIIFTPLHIAILAGNTNAIDILIDAGADLNKPILGMDVVDFAKMMNYENSAELLIQKRDEGRRLTTHK